MQKYFRKVKPKFPGTNFPRMLSYLNRMFITPGYKILPVPPAREIYLPPPAKIPAISPNDGEPEKNPATMPAKAPASIIPLYSGELWYPGCECEPQ